MEIFKNVFHVFKMECEKKDCEKSGSVFYKIVTEAESDRKV